MNSKKHVLSCLVTSKLHSTELRFPHCAQRSHGQCSKLTWALQDGLNLQGKYSYTNRVIKSDGILLKDRITLIW